MEEIRKGQMVFSKAGRDQGKCFIVLAYEKPYVFLVDGETRRLEQPKKKKVIHIQPTNFVDEEIHETLEHEGRITNADLRESIRRFTSQEAIEE